MEVTIGKQEKQIAAQKFVMNNLRSGIEYLKEHCKRDRTDGMDFLIEISNIFSEDQFEKGNFSRKFDFTKLFASVVE